MRAFAVMMPQLGAEERLAAINDQSAANGNLKKEDRARHVRNLERMAQGGQRRRAAKASAATLAGMGIGFVSSSSEPSQEAVNDG